MLSTISVPNLVSGISQQPPALRLASSLEDSVNQWPSVVTGLSPRFGTEHVADIGIAPEKGAMGFIIDRNDDYQYIVLIVDGDLKVYNLEGVEQTVAFPNGKAYLNARHGNPSNRFRLMTFQDTTFIVNRDVVVSENFIGEEGTTTYTPDGTADTLADFPEAAIGYKDDVYQALDSHYYYRCEEIPGTPEVVSWVRVGAGVPTGGRADGYSLPADPVAGATFNVFLYYDENGDDWCDFYEAQITQAGGDPTYEWVRRTLSQITGIPNGRLDPAEYGTVHVTQSISNSNYNIYINGTLKATFLTANGVDAANSVQGTDVIAEELKDDLVANGYTVTRIGSTLSIEGLEADDTIVISSTNGDKCMRCYRDVVKSFSDLPPNEAVGRIVKVKGAPEDNQDDYYVIFDEDDRWVETYAYNTRSGLAANNMPHVLVRAQNGIWTFKEHTWGKRNAGDEESNPLPSFVGYSLQDIFQYTNRIGFITEDNVIMSESNEFENYFRTTIATLLDTDPIDMAVISPLNDAMRHGVPYNKDLLIMGDLSQHRLSYQQLVGPKNINVAFTTSYNCASGAHPINMGSSVYFMDDREDYTNSRLMEYFVKGGQSPLDEAQDLSDPVPQYIPASINLLCGSPRLNVALIGSESEPSTLYVYKFFWNGEKKVQNAWGKWTFPNSEKIFWAAFSGDYLYMLIERYVAPVGDAPETTKVFLERMRVIETPNTRISLDRQVAGADLSIVHTPSVGDAPEYSTITLPYYTSVAPHVVAITDGVAVSLEATHTSGNSWSVFYDLTEADSVFAGIQFESKCVLTIPYVRIQKGGGEMVSEESVLLVKDLRVSFANMERIYAKLEVRGKTYERTFAYTGIKETGNIRLPMATNQHDTVITLWSDWPTGYQLTGAEWRGQIAPKSRRI